MFFSTISYAIIYFFCSEEDIETIQINEDSAFFVEVCGTCCNPLTQISSLHELSNQIVRVRQSKIFKHRASEHNAA